jgi:hypothetical protein
MNTKNNWLQYFYVDDDWQPSLNWQRTSPNQQCSMLITPYEFEPDLNFWESVCNTAKEMYSQFGEMVIGYSGGLDSEYAVLAFHHTKTPFRIMAIEWYWDNQLLNGHDVKYAYELSREIDKPIEIVKYNLQDLLLTDEWSRVAETYQAVSPYQHALLAVMENYKDLWLQVDEIETLTVHELDKTYWAFEKREDQDMCWRKFNRLTKLSHLNNFFTYRLETIDSWFKNTIVSDLTSWKIYGKLSFTSSKHKIYQENCPYRLKPRPKYFGLEKIAAIWENNIVDKINTLEINDHMCVPAKNITEILRSKETYSNVFYKKTRLPRPI